MYHFIPPSFLNTYITEDEFQEFLKMKYKPFYIQGSSKYRLLHSYFWN